MILILRSEICTLVDLSSSIFILSTTALYRQYCLNPYLYRMNNLALLGTFIKQSYRTHHEGSALHRYAQQIADRVAAETIGPDYHQIPRNWQRKMQWYMVETIWLAGQFNRLLDREMSSEEQQNLAYCGGMFTIGDLLVDETGSSADRLTGFLEHPEPEAAGNPLERLYEGYYRRFFATVDKSCYEEVWYYFRKLNEAQLASRKQMVPQTEAPVIDHITRKKGGISFQGCRALIPRPFAGGEREAMYQLGVLVQLLNDTQDLHKDSRAGIRNFANVQNDLESIREQIKAQQKVAFQFVSILPYSARRKKYFLFNFHCFVVGIMAKLRHYEQLCEGVFSMERFLQLTPRQVRLSPFSWSNVRYCLPEVLKFGRSD